MSNSFGGLSLKRDSGKINSLSWYFFPISLQTAPDIMKGSKKNVFPKPTLEYEYIQNLTVVQKLFFTINEKKDVEIQQVA